MGKQKKKRTAKSKLTDKNKSNKNEAFEKMSQIY